MKRRYHNLLAGALVTTSTIAWSAGDIDAGKAKAAMCAACHGPDGNSVNPQWPKLAGQHAEYLALAMKAYKSGERKNVIMAPMAAPLSDADIENLAAYFASQEHK